MENNEGIPYRMRYLLLFGLSIICFIDIKTKHISNLITILGMSIGLIYNYFSLDSILGIIVGVLSVHCLNTLKINNLGGGDCKLLGMLGAFLGWQAILIIYGLSILLVIPYKIYRLVKGKQGAYAYSPFITISSLLFFIYG